MEESLGDSRPDIPRMGQRLQSPTCRRCRCELCHIAEAQLFLTTIMLLAGSKLRPIIMLIEYET